MIWALDELCITPVPGFTRNLSGEVIFILKKAQISQKFCIFEFPSPNNYYFISQE